MLSQGPKRLLLAVCALALCSCTKKEEHNTSASVTPAADRILQVTSDLYIQDKAAVVTDIFSTSFSSPLRAFGLRWLYPLTIGPIEGFLDSESSMTYSFQHVHDDDRISISAPNSEHSLSHLGSSPFQVIRIGKSGVPRAPEPRNYRIQFEVHGAVTRDEQGVHLLWPVLSDHRDLPVEHLTARLHFPASVKLANITTRLIRTSRTKGTERTLIQNGNLKGSLIEEAENQRPLFLIELSEPISPLEGVFLRASWPSPSFTVP